MILALIKQKQSDLNQVLLFLKEAKVKNTQLFMIIFDNLDALTTASEIIDKSINQELVELNDKVVKLLNEYSHSKDKLEIIDDDHFKFGLTLLSDEDREKRSVLESEYINDMNTLEKDVKLSVIPRELIENIEFDVDSFHKIRFFFDSKNWETPVKKSVEKKKNVKR
jgi:hypothetical protein